MTIKIKYRTSTFTGSEYEFGFQITNPLTLFEGTIFIRTSSLPPHNSLQELSDNQIAEAIVSEFSKVVTCLAVVD
jgi:hypothetical protein